MNTFWKIWDDLSDYTYYPVYTYGKVRGYIQPYISTDFMVNKITDCIYIGDISSAFNRDELKKLGITHILSAILGVDPPFPNDFTYMNVHIRDVTKEPLSQHLDECVEFIEQAVNNGERILIHCMAGKSRSVSIVIAYLIKQGMSFTEAYDLVKFYRRVANPNQGFVKQLVTYENVTRASDTSKSCIF